MLQLECLLFCIGPIFVPVILHSALIRCTQELVLKREKDTTMPQELNLHFKNALQVTIHFAQHSPITIDFAIPLHPQDREAIRHYL